MPELGMHVNRIETAPATASERTGISWHWPAEILAESRDFNPCPSCDQVSAAGHSQGIAFVFGRGRVVIIGEMGALVDCSVPGMQNRQFALTIVRWLNREL